MAGLTLVMIARVPPAGLDDFLAYETNVLALLAYHGAKLERRIRSEDSTTEVHIVFFPSSEAFEAFLSDPRREAAKPLLERSTATVEVFHGRDVLGID